jgi:hypothetical protein
VAEYPPEGSPVGCHWSLLAESLGG